MATEKTEILAPKVSQLIHKFAIWPTLFAAIALLLVFYYPAIFADLGDGELFVSPASLIHPDRVPIWDTNADCGMPIWGNPGGVAQINIIDSALYSFLRLFREFIPDIKFIYLVINLLLLSGTMFAFARRNDISPLSALIVSLLVLIMPHYAITVLGGAYQQIFAFALLPAVLLFMQNLLERRKLFWFGLAAFFYAWQLLRASASITFITTAFIGLLVIRFSLANLQKKQLGSVLNGALLLMAAIVCGFLAASYIYAPLLEYLNYARPEFDLRTVSLSNLMLFILASFNGNVAQSPAFAFYVGSLTLFFAGFAILLKQKLSILVWAAAVLVGVIAAIFGWAIQAAFAIPFAMIILAGTGLDALIHSTEGKSAHRRRVDIYMIMVFSFFAAILALVLLNKAAIMRHFLNEIPLLKLPQQQEFYKAVLLESVLIFSFILITFIVIRLYVRRMMGSGFLSLIVLLLALLDLLLVDYRITFPEKRKEIPQNIVHLLEKEEKPFRFFSTLEQELPEQPSILAKDRIRLTLMKEFDAESGYGQPDMMGMRNPFFSKYTRLVSRFGEIIEEPIPVQYVEPHRLHFDRSMLDMLNVKYILCNSPIYDPQYRSLSDSEVYVFENTTALPRAFFVDSVAVLPGRRAIFDAMRMDSFYPTKIMYLEKEPPFEIVSNDSNRAAIAGYDGRKITIKTDVKEPAALLLSEVFYPAGWKAFVDNNKTEIYKANHFLRAVFLQPGTHELELRFAPMTFLLGWWTSLIMFVVLVISVIVSGAISIWSSHGTQDII